MNTTTSAHLIPDRRIVLDRKDIVRHEPFLKEALSGFLEHNSCSLYFPSSLPRDVQAGEDSAALAEGRAVYDKSARTLLLPLVLDGQVLAALVAREVRLTAPKSLLPYLCRLATANLEKLLLHKIAVTDPQTGLFNRSHFQQRVEEEINRIHACISPNRDSCLDPGLPGYSGCFGLLLADLDRFRRVNETYGHTFGDAALLEAARTLREICPEDGLAARLSGDVFAMLLPGGTPGKCAKLAERARLDIPARTLFYALTQEEVSLSVSLGSAIYPHDMRGEQLRKPVSEQARIILEKAEMALTAAKKQGRGGLRSFRNLLAEGGVILERLPLSRLRVSLGRRVDAKEGQRFLVWPGRADGSPMPPGRYPMGYKGEILLMEVRENDAVAEILFLTDPSALPGPGDSLTYLPERESLIERSEDESSQSARRDALTGLYSYRDFLRFWNAERAKAASFGLALIRLDSPRRDPSPDDPGVEGVIRDIADAAQQAFGPEAVGGRYSLNSLIWHIPAGTPDSRLDAARELAAGLTDSLNLQIEIGLAEHPFLNFAKADALENARKALEHAALLTEPRVARAGSVSLTISADKLFTLGDFYAAMQEYKLAMLADESNQIARNSLGICYARLGRLQQARTLFVQAREAEPGNPTPVYNHGYACLKLGDIDEAAQAFRECLTLAPGHLFSLIRLGQIAEQRGELEQARDYFEQAAHSPGGEGLSLRYVARLALRLNDPDRAKEKLHLALLADPTDAFSLHLLARLYLDAGEDPQIAETLARQAVALRPDQKVFWQELSRALSAQGKEKEAASAAERAG